MKLPAKENKGHDVGSTEVLNCKELYLISSEYKLEAQAWLELML